MNAILRAEGLCKSYGNLAVLDGVTFAVEPRESLAVVGPSGCGKTTLLRLLLDLECPDRGAVARGYDHVGYLPQGGLLFPWKTVVENVGLPLELQGVSARERSGIVRKELGRFGLAGFEGAYPRELSGGMAQRAALLRTVLTGAPVLFLDEPFGALDTMTRQRLQDWLGGLTGILDRTLLLVTHDLEEALVLCSRVLVFSPRPGAVRGEVRRTAGDRGAKISRLDERFLEDKARVLEILEKG